MSHSKNGRGVGRVSLPERSAATAAWHRDLFERGLALFLLALGLPWMAAIGAWIALVDGRPVLHRGTRLGRGRQPFTMFKLRTLKRDAQRVTGPELLNHSHSLTIRGGKFLRDTRLDELPQLWNVARGDMSLVGPRPERPEVYEAQCRAIPGYERRFAVRPGLIGISQLFTPHATAKRYRTLIDNGSIRRSEQAAYTLRVVAFTLQIVLRKSVTRATRFLSSRLRGRWQRERRRLRREVPVGARACFGAAPPGGWRVLDMSEDSLLVECGSEPVECLALGFELHIPLDRGGALPARRSARCTGQVLLRRGVSRVVLRYRPCSLRSEYMIHQYFLRTSLAPRPSWKGRSGARPPLAPFPRDSGRAKPVSVG